MLDSILEFWYFVTDRDTSKWYTFSILDLCLLAHTGVDHWVTDGKDSCIGFWIFVIVMNSVISYYHNKE